MTTRTVTWCTKEELNCAVDLPTTAYLCVPAEIVLNAVDDDIGIVVATVTAVRQSKVTDSCGACGFVYTLAYDDTQLVANHLITSAALSSVFCKDCWTVFAQSMPAQDIRSLLSVEDTDSVDLTYDSGSGIFSADVEISADGGNQVELRADGLFVPALPGFNLVDTEAIDLSLTGTDLSADLVLSADVGNTAEIRADGLYVPALGGFSVSDTDSIDMDLSGTVFSAELKVSADPLNLVEVHSDGLWVPAQDGWIPDAGGFAYASATTITVASDARLRYRVGDKIKFTQGGGIKYFIVTGVAATLLTVTGGIVYTLVNTPITLPFFSHDATPVAFPRFFTWDPAGGFVAGGAMSVASVVVSLSIFDMKANDAFFTLSSSFTIGGTPNPALYIPNPITGYYTGFSGPARVEGSGGIDAGGFWRVDFVDQDLFLIGLEGFANWAAGDYTLEMQGFYPAP